MDNLVLIRVASSLRQTLIGTVFQDAHQEGPRFHLIFLRDDHPRTVAVSLDPDQPWAGRPSVRRRSRRMAPGPFVAALKRTLRGSVLAAVDKPPAERRVLLQFADGKTLVLELSPRGANMLLVNGDGLVMATARRAGGRNVPNEPYRPLPFPKTRLDPFEADPAAVDELVRSRGDRGERPEQALLRGFLGIDRPAAELIARESRETGRSLGEVVVERLGALSRGQVDPVIETSGESAEDRLLPWVPEWPAEPTFKRVSLDDPAATAGAYHETLEQERFLQRRSERLCVVLKSEIRRQREVEAKVAADALRFEDPERFRKNGEALLAGLSQARRVGDRILVPDPYHSEGHAMAVEVPPGCSLTRAAELYFDRHRRANRGLLRTRERARQVSERRTCLERIREQYSGKTDSRSVESLQREMQEAGIPIALEAFRAGTRSPSPPGRPRLEGVRLFTTGAGDSVLIGKSGKDNDRLTFRLASPEDFWLHALGVRGAHVVVRNDTGAARPRTASLREAAGAAAWFSEARRQSLVDVQWTRRKLVRRIRGAPPGTVRVKRSETVRVKPRRPPDP